MRIFLIGFMGAGKSYKGRRLAKRLDIPFIDLDKQIEDKAQKSINRIFEEEGEAAFRKLEQETLHEMQQYENAIIATGGGVPCFFDNMGWMNKNGLTIYLKASPALLTKHLLPKMAHRPLLKGFNETQLKNFIADRLSERDIFYHRCQWVVEIDKVEDVIQVLENKIRAFK